MGWDNKKDFNVFVGKTLKKITNGKITFQDGLFLGDVVSGNLLQEVYRNGQLLVDEKFSDIKSRVLKNT